MGNKKHIAVLSTMYYPDMGAPSACIDKYLQLIKDQYIIHIITKTTEVKIPRHPYFDIRYISRLLHKTRNWCHNNIKGHHLVLFSKLILAGINIIKLLQTQVSFPSAQKWEITEYLKVLEKLNSENHLHTVIPVSNNFVTQLAMLKFKKRHPDIKWIAFITDPYSDSYIYYKYKLFKQFWKKLNLKKEQQIYDCSDHILLTAEMYKFIPTAFQVSPFKIHKIEFALQKHKEKSNENTNNEQSNDCRLIYAGLFYKEIRNPEFTLNTLSQVPDISLDLFVCQGECEEIISKFISSHIHRYEYVDHERYIKMINSEYDILVNVGNNATLQAPSKMLELLSTGKPIINFYHAKDSQYDMIKKYPLGLNIGKEDVNAVDKASRFCKQMKNKQISYEEVQALFPDNNLEKQVQLLLNLIEE